MRGWLTTFVPRYKSSGSTETGVSHAGARWSTCGRSVGIRRPVHSQLVRGTRSLITRHIPIFLKFPPRILVGKYGPEFCKERIVFAFGQLRPRH